jgi:hypothetical protein
MNDESISQIEEPIEDREKIPAIQPSVLMDEETAKKIDWSAYYPF